jgi:hypothetical protein
MKVAESVGYNNMCSVASFVNTGYLVGEFGTKTGTQGTCVSSVHDGMGEMGEGDEMKIA